VILCRRGKAEEVALAMRAIIGKLKLTVNEEKTRACKIPEETFDFLVYPTHKSHTGNCLEQKIQRHRNACIHLKAVI
jgi:hypothetical protein